MKERKTYPYSATLFYASEDAREEIDCDVIIKDGQITIEFDDQFEHIYKGTEKGRGHFLLTDESSKWRMTLHSFDKSSILEGYLHEENHEYMLRIRLK